MPIDIKLFFKKVILATDQAITSVKDFLRATYNFFTKPNAGEVCTCCGPRCYYKKFHEKTKRKVLVLATISTVFVSLIVALIFPGRLFTKAAISSWIQSSWSSGLDGGTYPNHTSNQTDWTKYSAKDADLTAGATLSLSEVAASVSETSDGDFNAGSQGNTYTSNGTVILMLPPSQTTDLTPTAGNAQIVLNWSAPASNGSAITAYNVYRSTSSGAETLLTTLGNVLTYTNTGLTNGTTYYYKVSAVNAIGEGGQSDESNTKPFTVTAFSFTNQTGVALSTAITSNGVVLAGGFSNLSATCTNGCTMDKNSGGTFTGSGTLTFSSGDTIRIRRTSSGSYNTAITTTTVTIGSTTSSAWSVTTTPTVNAFNFGSNVTGAAVSSTNTSPNVTPTATSGSYVSLVATCSANCTISKNGGAYSALGGTQTLSTGDYMTIRIVASASYNTAVTASVTMGGVTSTVWSVTTRDYIAGDAYAGGKVVYYNSPTDYMVAGVADKGTAVWGCSGTTISGADGTALGTGNQNTIDIMSGCATAGIAARVCGDLDEGGYTDWYLPSIDELDLLYQNKEVIGSFQLSPYWSSTEYDSSGAREQHFYNGNQGYPPKTYSYYVRCVRGQ